MPKLTVNLDKLDYNLTALRGFCAGKGLELAGVLKCGHSLPWLLERFQESGVGVIAFSRVQPVIGLKKMLRSRPLLIGLPSPGQAKAVVAHFSASFNSESETIRALAAAAADCGFEHGIYLMVDIGDLREGVPPEAVLPMLDDIGHLFDSRFGLAGLAANLGCGSGTLPDEDNLRILEQLAAEIERHPGLAVPKISIGGTVVYPWVREKALPARINQLRLGEGILCGHCPGYDVRIEGLHDDVFLFSAEVLEVKEKVSPPSGERGTDAFGCVPSLGPAGRRRRAILDFGLVDTGYSGLTPILPGVQFITGNSEYTVVDVTDCPEKIKVNSRLTFKTTYESMTRALISPFVETDFSGENCRPKISG
ncbi:MAG: hypothetical protein A3F83_02835 [Candidatus Glassbacteria bacterium RIFCSPLOWO2_12_FULL_58_11]|uniref:Alanine racemase N-terminal domain-containing protein n=1 Tax=Candidatus Glassbacteria bacterium RIFCSPLOWO2_12_FULL_58_11 TaxID=1817867 RepID=A0A1F5YWS6_9BACT|nr:MAG: hypothetical protein A3F83_02835 [Candidatus Glassbacteria bacterium RIFCSPLOWO2_12_FULL_58_11]